METCSTIKVLFILYSVSGPESESESESEPESELIRSPESESEHSHHDSAPLIYCMSITLLKGVTIDGPKPNTANV